MRAITSVPYAMPSLASSLAMASITTVHHLHAALTLDPGGDALHVVWNELVLVPMIVASLFLYLRRGNRLALGVYLLIAFAGFVGLGLYEGGWNHTVKLLAHLRIDSPATRLSALLPPDDPHRWFHEITGVATFVSAMAASYYTLRFALVVNGDAHDGRRGSSHV